MCPLDNLNVPTYRTLDIDLTTGQIKLTSSFHLLLTDPCVVQAETTLTNMLLDVPNDLELENVFEAEDIEYLPSLHYQILWHQLLTINDDISDITDHGSLLHRVFIPYYVNDFPIPLLQLDEVDDDLQILIHQIRAFQGESD